MTREKLTFTSTIAYVWAPIIMFGAVLMHTFLLYPNIFRDVPASLQQAMDFMTTSSPHDVFAPFGAALIVTGVVADVLTWRVPSARYWIVASLGTLLIEKFLFSVVYFWPGNTIPVPGGFGRALRRTPPTGRHRVPGRSLVSSRHDRQHRGAVILRLPARPPALTHARSQ